MELTKDEENTTRDSDALVLESICNAVGEALIVVNEIGRITYSNPAAVTILGSSQEVLNGQLFKDATSLYQAAEINEIVFSKGITLYNQKNTIVTQDGVHLPIIFTVAPIHTFDRVTNLVYSFHDNSQQAQREQKILTFSRYQESLTELAQRLMLCNSLTLMMNAALSSLTRTLKMPFACVYSHQQDALQFAYGKGWSKGLDATAASIFKYSRKGYSLLSQKPYIIENLLTDTRFPHLPFLLEHNVISGICIVIHGNKRPFGLLATFSDQKRSFTDEDLAFLEAVSSLISTSVTQKCIEAQAAVVIKQVNERFRSIKSFAAHELEAPLRKMKTFSEYIEMDAKETLSRESMDYLVRIQQSADQMQLLIQEWVNLGTE